MKKLYIVIHIIDNMIEQIETTGSVMVAREIFRATVKLINPNLKPKQLKEATINEIYFEDDESVSIINMSK